jgi:hypothetical protein
MTSNPVRSLRARSIGLAGSLAILIGSAAACTAVGRVKGPTGTGQGTGSAGSTGSGNGGTGSGTGTGGSGGVVAIPNNGMVTANTSWYDSFSTADCSGPPTALPSSRIWRLSAVQWQNTVAAALGVSAPDVSAFPPDQLDPRTGYNDDSTGDKITLGLASAYFDKSGSAATAAAPGVLAAVSCLGQNPVSSTCGQMFVSQYGAKLFRRALTATETMSYASFFASQISAGDPAQTAVASTLSTMMMSPSFAFRTELGSSKPGPVDLTSDEIASLLSYSIADIPPDMALQAVQAQLTDPAVRQAQAERLAAMPAAKTKLNQFWSQYLALGDQPTAAGIDQSAWNEATTFFSKVVWDNNGTLKDLLTANYTWGDKMVGTVYGAQPDATGKIMLDSSQRAGFLTSIAMLSQTAAPSQAATVIHRGLLVRERVLCQIPPPPPATVVPDPTQIQMAGPNATAKQNYTQFTMDHASCNACHSFFQPLGLAFEAYDASGKFRTQYPAPISQPIDTTGTLSQAGDAMGDYQNVPGMAAMLGNSKMAGYCMAQQFAEYALGRSVSLDQEACTVRSMGDYVTGKQGQVHTLLASFAATPTLTRRFHQ